MLSFICSGCFVHAQICGLKIFKNVKYFYSGVTNKWSLQSLLFKYDEKNTKQKTTVLVKIGKNGEK